MKKARLFRLSTVAMLMLTLIITSAASAFAAAPVIKKVDYEGKGKVEIDFSKDVAYKNVKVKVKDTSGKKYKVTIVEKDEDDMTFKIKNFKKGKKYKFTISGVKVIGTSKYGKVSGTVKIPAAKKSTTISKSKALNIAVKHAQDKFNAANIRDKEAEKDIYNGKASWDVSFEGKINGKWYDFEYDISRSSGKILHSEKERD